MKKIVILILVLFILGCGAEQQQVVPEKVEQKPPVIVPTATEPKQEIPTPTIPVIKQEDLPIEEQEMIEKEWCIIGGYWQVDDPNLAIFGEGEWIIHGVILEGKYKDLCHVVYQVKVEEQALKLDYFFSENGKHAYYELEFGGEKIVDEWHAEK